MRWGGGANNIKQLKAKQRKKERENEDEINTNKLPGILTMIAGCVREGILGNNNPRPAAATASIKTVISNSKNYANNNYH